MYRHPTHCSDCGPSGECALCAKPARPYDISHKLASELVLLGRTVSAAEARDRFRLYDGHRLLESHADSVLLDSVNFVVSRQDVVTAAIRVAVELTHNSPDAVQSSRKAIWDVADSLGVEDAFQKHVWRPENARVYSGTNLQVRVSRFDDDGR
jgi:enoyl-CoA hydratase/carnithine racemase